MTTRTAARLARLAQTDPQRALWEGVREQDLQKRLGVLCRALGLLYYHPHDSRRDDAGFPDTTIVRPRSWGPPYVVWAELKSERGAVSGEQERWGEWLVAAAEPSGGAVAYRLLRPSGWDAFVREFLTPPGGGPGEWGA